MARMRCLGCALPARACAARACRLRACVSWQDARWRRGESVSLNDARNAMVGIEAAAHSQMVFQKR